MPSGQGLVEIRGMIVDRCMPEVSQLQQTVVNCHPAWLMMGAARDDTMLHSLWQSVRGIWGLRLAMLGPLDDANRCERWVRQGCVVYLAISSTMERVASALHAAETSDVVIIDRVFQLLAESLRTGPIMALTRREHEVLNLLCQGLRNSDIAAALHVSESTIEFHVRHLLSKLSARNRVQIVRQAIVLGLR